MRMLGHCSVSLFSISSATLLQCLEFPMQNGGQHFMELLTPLNAFASCCQGHWPSRIPVKEAAVNSREQELWDLLLFPHLLK